jgi:predicted NBD/HSP70 family sugar kinase
MTTHSVSASNLALAIDPQIGRIQAFAEILMAAGCSALAEITPSTIAVIGGDISKAADEIAKVIETALNSNHPKGPGTDHDF